MDCPKCTGTLHQADYGENISVHRCDVCAGLWCKPDMLENMKSMWMSEAVLDTGSPRVGSTLNAVADIDCPEGHGKMQKCSDSNQHHIWFEQCTTCGGVFLDAGEFTDLKYDTLMDRVRGMLKGPRPSD